MDNAYTPPPANEALWRAIFETGDPKLEAMRTQNARLPSDPRCRLCKAPFGGLGGFYFRLRGRGRALRSPQYCSNCDRFIVAHPGGAEVTMSMIFADVRQSSLTAAETTPTEFRAHMEGFFKAAREAIVESEGFVAEFRGDCVVGTFPPGFCGPDHAKMAIDCSRRMLKAFSGRPGRPPLAVGIGVHTGRVFVGTLGLTETASPQDVGILGQAANVCAQLSQVAAAGEALITEAASRAAGDACSGAPKVDVALKSELTPISTFAIKAS